MGPLEVPTIIVAAGLVGIGVVALMLGHREVVNSGPALILTPSYAADISTIQNQTQAVRAMVNMREIASTPSN